MHRVRGPRARRRSAATSRSTSPPGIADGQRIRLAGSGHAGEHGGPPGDLYVQVHVRPDEQLIRDGDDLVTVLDVPAPLAALGADLPVTALGGELDVHVPTGTQPGEVVVVKGRGHAAPAPPRAPRRPARLRERPHPAPADAGAARAARHARGRRSTPENLAAPETMTGKLRRLLGGRR